MVKPPREVGMSGVFEIDDDVCISIEQAVVKKLVCAMSQPGILEPRPGIELAS
jgi:hypothetical protein